MILAPERQAEVKASLIEKLGIDRAVAIGNGANHALMIEKAGLGSLSTEPRAASAKRYWPPTS
jgi:soluble P-type ATPase